MPQNHTIKDQQEPRGAADVREWTIAQQAERIEALTNSTSWKLTRPVRFVGDLFRKFNRSPNTQDKDEHAQTYADWIARCESIAYRQEEAAKAVVAPCEDPCISILLAVYDPPEEFLDAAIWSVRRQDYASWELCIADDGSRNPRIHDLIRAHTESDERIRAVFRSTNGGISAASNAALELANSEWVALLDHDDLLAHHALKHVAQAARSHPHAKLIYSDEDKVNAEGQREAPYFKPDWNRTLFCSHHLMAHLAVYSADLLRAVGGFRSEFDGAQDYDLALRCVERLRDDQIIHLPRVLYHWRIHPQSTADVSSNAKPLAMIRGERALNEHFARVGLRARAHLTGHGYRIRYDLPSPAPSATIIILTKDHPELLARCLDGLLEKTEYADYEILVVDNGTTDPTAKAYLGIAPSRGPVRVLTDEGPFNYPRLNNRAVEKAKGDVIILLNNDTEVINETWLREMVSIAIQPRTGAVGALLLFPDGKVQHGGVVLGVNNWAGHAHKGCWGDSPGHAGRLSLSSEFSAVTGACLAVRKKLYQEVGGLDEELSVACNDVDFCLKLREKGYRNVFTPFAKLIHHESASRGDDGNPANTERHEKELALMRRRWGTALRVDPNYNPNLTLEKEDFSLAWPPRIGGQPQSES